MIIWVIHVWSIEILAGKFDDENSKFYAKFWTFLNEIETHFFILLSLSYIPVSVYSLIGIISLVI